MELRTLRYFLAVCEHGTMSRAAEALHITQPALSRQIAALERELSCKLLERHSRSVSPTEQGLYLKRRAEEIVALADRTEADFSHNGDIVAGDIHVGAGESDGVRVVTHAMKTFHDRYPGVRFHLHSAIATDLIDRLEHGIDDLAVLMTYTDVDRYHRLRLEPTDAWGVIMCADDPLAERELVTPEDLAASPLIMPERWVSGGAPTGQLATWFGDVGKTIDVVATSSLPFNSINLVREGLGRLVTFDGLVATGGDTGLAFRLLYPPAVSVIDVVWKRGQHRTNAVRLFLEHLKATAQGI